MQETVAVHRQRTRQLVAIIPAIPREHEFAAMMPAITTKAILNTTSGANAAMAEPQATPSTAGIVHSADDARHDQPFAHDA